MEFCFLGFIGKPLEPASILLRGILQGNIVCSGLYDFYIGRADDANEAGVRDVVRFSDH